MGLLIYCPYILRERERERERVCLADDARTFSETSASTGGVWGWQVGATAPAPRFRPKVVLISLSSYILR
jgi:hypothetical protein